MALLCSVAIQVAPLILCFYVLFYIFLLSLFTRITSALIIYDKRTFLDVGHFIHESNVAIGDSLKHRGEQKPPE